MNQLLNPHFASLVDDLYEDKSKIENWLNQQFLQYPAPFYSSFDVRMSDFKCSVVDANFYPAGFNNLASESTQSNLAEKLRDEIHTYAKNASTVFLLVENFNRNTHYQANVNAINEALIKSRFSTRIGILEVVSDSNLFPQLEQFKFVEQSDGHYLSSQDGILADFIVANRDFTISPPSQLLQMRTPIAPHPSHGWFRRNKSRHSDIAHQVMTRFSQEFAIKDSWMLFPLHKNCSEINYLTKSGMDCIMRFSGELINTIHHFYDLYSIPNKPYIVVKPDAGTYGMGILIMDNPDEITSLNRSKRTKLSYTKESKNNKVIIQEGVPTIERGRKNPNAISETVLYFIGSSLVGSFKRSHENSTENGNLNQTGSFFEPIHDLDQYHQDPMEYVKLLIAKLSLLAMAQE